MRIRDYSFRRCRGGSRLGRQSNGFGDGFGLAFPGRFLFLACDQLDPRRAADGVLGDRLQDVRIFLLT